MAGSYHWVLPAVLASACLLYLGVREERARVRAAVCLFGFSIVGVVVGGGLLSINLDQHPGYLAVRGIGRFLEAVAIVSLANVFLFSVALRRLRMELPRILQDLLAGFAYTGIALVVLSDAGVDLRGIVATSAVITAVIGFSLQDTLGNIMSGMAVQMDRTIRVGDWIRLGEVEGKVMEIRWRHTSVETREWDTVVIPNSVLMKGMVTLLGQRVGAPVQRRRWVYFNVDFRHAPTEVIQVIETALRAERFAGVAVDPVPHCIMTAFADSFSTFAVRYWLTDLSLPDPIDSLMRGRIFSALMRAGMPPSIPATAVFQTKDNENLRQRKRDEQLEGRLGVLAKTPLFHALTDEERKQLAPRLKSAPFVAGETMTRQGNEAHWLYIIVHGEAEVNVSVADQTQHVATLKDGDYFGEMGMLTGARRGATVVAMTDVKTYRVGKDDFEDIIHRRPEMAVDIAHTLHRRQAELQTVKEGVSEQARRTHAPHSHGVLLDRIQEFFGIHLDP